MKFQLALPICYLVVVTIQSTSARIFNFQDVTVNGTLLKQSGYCDLIGGKKLGSYPTLGQDACLQKCVANPKCTHIRVFGCTLLQSSTCLNINMTTYQSCGYVPDRTCPKQATTVDDNTKMISVCQ